jgi:hypothetical protein
VNQVETSIKEIEDLIVKGYYLSAAALYKKAIMEYGEKGSLSKLAIVNRLNSNIDFSANQSVDVEKSNFRSFDSVSHKKFVSNSFVDGEFTSSKPKNAHEHYMFNKTHYVRKQRDLLKISNATLCIDRTKPYKFEYYIFDENDNYIETLSQGRSPFLFGNEIYHLNKKIGFIEDRFTRFNVCHLLLDKIPRIFEIEDFHDSIDSYFLFQKNNYLTQIQELIGRKFEDLSGYTGNKICIKISELVLSSSSSYSKMHPAQVCYDYLTRTIDALTKNVVLDNQVSNRRIFIDRGLAATRRILNNEEFVDILKKYDFESVQLEKLSFNQQIKVFVEASFVLGVHGAGLTNIVFCRPDTKVVEILPKFCATKSFWLPSNKFHLDYNAFIANDEGNTQIDYSNWEHRADLYNKKDVLIDCHEFELFLKTCL